jgi:hypothetical protein
MINMYGDDALYMVGKKNALLFPQKFSIGGKLASYKEYFCSEHLLLCSKQS